MTERGCPIEDIAADIELNEQVDNYLLMKRLPIAKESKAVSERLLERSGLHKDIDTLIELETIYHNHQAAEHKASGQRTRRNNKGGR